MTVSATTVTQYYTGIFRQAPSSAVSAGYQAMANDAAALNSMLSAANIQVDPVVRLYQTAFNRLPDTAGMTAWVVPFSTGAITLQAIANGFTQSTEFTTLYPTSMSNAQYVGALYWNILQRAGEDAGIKGWTDALNSGALTRAQVLLGFSDSGEFTKKVEPNVNTFLTKIAETPVADQGKASLYTGSLFDQGGVVPGDTYTLTTNIETVPASGTLPNGAAVVGVVAAAGSTFQTGDTINGTANGNNIITITDAGTAAAAVVATVNNVSAIRHNLLNSNAYDASLYTGVMQHYAANAAANAVLTITNGQIATSYGARDSASNSFTVNVGIRAADTIGATTTLNLNVNNAGSVVAPPGVDASVNTATINSTSTGIETINITTAGTNVIAVTGTAGAGVATDNSKVVVTGAGANTINVAALTQALTYDLSGATGNNTLRFNQALQSNTAITGGTGTDSVRVDQNSVVAGISLKDVEILRSATGAANASTGTIAFTSSSLTTLRVDGDTNEGGRLSLVSPGAIATMDYRGDGLTAQAANAQTFKAVTITGAYAGSSDAVIMNFSNSGITQLNGYVLNNGGLAGDAAAIVANGIETLTINANDVAATATTAFTNGVSTAGITSNTLQSIKVTTAGGVNLGVINAAPVGAANSALTSIDLSAVAGTAASTISFDGVETVGAATQIIGPSGTSALTITTGIQGATDTLLITGGKGNTTINAQNAIVGGTLDAFAGTLVFTSATAGITNDLNIGDRGAAGAGASVSTSVFTLSGAGARNDIDGGVGADTLTITASGLGSNNTVDMAEGNDSVNASGSSVAVAIAGDAGADTVIGGSAADTITGGTGVDSMTGGLGADDFVQAGQVAAGGAANQGTINADVITDFSVAQVDQIGNWSIGNLEDLAALTDLVTANNGTTVTAGAVVVGTLDVSAAVNTNTLAAGTSLVTISGNYANAAALQAAIRANLTVNGIEAADGFLVAYDNGTSTNIALVTSADADDGTLLAAAVVSDLVTLTGVADATTLTNANFLAFVA